MKVLATLDLTDKYMLHDVPVICHDHPTEVDNFNACAKAIEAALQAVDWPEIDGHQLLSLAIKNVTDDGSGNVTIENRFSIARQTSGPVEAGYDLDNLLAVGKPCELERVVLTCKNTGSGGSDLVIDILLNDVSMFDTPGNRPTIAAASGSNQIDVTNTQDITTTTLLETDVLSFSIVSAPDGCEDVALVLWFIL